jgi:hypothetical protein
MRLHLAPPFRRRPSESPWAAPPLWIGPGFDIDGTSATAVPSPGHARLSELRRINVPLDRSRPL